MKQLVAKSTKIKVAKTKKVKQYIASAKQKRSKHSSYVVAHRKQNLKIARAAHRWGVKVANFCKGLKGIFASL